MGQSNGRTGRIVCFVLSILLLATAAFLLTDAVQVDTEPQATKLIVLAQVLATGSVALMIGALVWTLAARGRSHPDGSGQGRTGQVGPGHDGSGQVGSGHGGPERAWVQPEHPGAGHPPPGYGGGPAQEAWVPPPTQTQQHRRPGGPHG